MNILHISDLHYGFDKGETATAKRINYMNKLIAKLNELSKTITVDYIFFTGDFAWNAMESEFDSAAKFIIDLTSAFKLSPEKIFLCPGNHDVDREELEDKAFPNTQEEANKFLQVEKLEKLSRAFTEYIRFCTNLNVAKYKIGSKESYLTGCFSDGTINVICLNSAWYAIPSKARNGMWIGSNFIEVIEANNDLASTCPTITIVHHPNEKWHEEESNYFGHNINLRDKVCKMSGMVLSGHTHAVKSSPTYIKGACVVGTGALYDDSNYENSFSIYTIQDHAQSGTHYYIHNGEWKDEAIDDLDGFNLKKTLSPVSKIPHESMTTPSSGDQISWHSYDRAISAISYKSLDGLTKRVYDVDRSNGFPIYTSKCRRATDILEPFMTSNRSPVKYERVLESCLKQIQEEKTVVVDGMQGTGKSSLMSFLYLDVLTKFRSGEIDCYPIYLDIHEYIKREDFLTVSELKQDVAIIKEMIQNAPTMQWVFFVDGIDGFKSNFESYESIVYSVIADHPEQMVLCIGAAESIHASSHRNTYGQFDLYVKSSTIRTTMKSARIHDLSIDKLLSILREIHNTELSRSQIQTVENWIRQYCNGYLDYRTLVMFFHLVTEPSTPETTPLAERMLAYHKRMVGSSNLDFEKLCNATVQYISGYKAIPPSIKPEHELIIHRNKLSRDFLFAYYWIQLMGKRIPKRKQGQFNRIAKWKTIFPRTVNRFISDLTPLLTTKIYVENMKTMYNCASQEMKINISFLLGRLKDKTAISFLQTTWESLDKFAQTFGLNDQDFRLYRTISISLISQENETVEKAYLTLLTKEPTLATSNMVYHCLYYYDKCDFTNLSGSKSATPDMLHRAHARLCHDIQFALSPTKRKRAFSKISLKLDIITYITLLLSCSEHVFNELEHKETDTTIQKILDSSLPKYIREYVKTGHYYYQLRQHRI